MNPLIRFTYDTAMIGLIHNDDDVIEYIHALLYFLSYYNDNFLELNVFNTKEVVLNFHFSAIPPPYVFIDGIMVDRVSSCKCLSVHLNISVMLGNH